MPVAGLRAATARGPAARAVLSPSVAFVGLAFACGLAWRIVGFVNRPSLSLDEARLALNIATRPYAALASGLGHDQSAPLLFLWLEKAVVDVFGVSDLALRLVPLAAGIGVLWLTYPTFRQIVSPVGAAFATAVVACMPVLVYYSTSIKQYGVEVLVTLVLVKFAAEWLTGARDRGPIALLAVGLVAPWVSAPAVFVLGGIVAAMAMTGAFRDDGRVWRTLRWVIPLWGASSAAAYWVTYYGAARSHYLRHYWGPAFLTPEPAHLWASLSSVGREFFGGITIGYPGVWGQGIFNGMFALIGATVCVFCGWGVIGFGRRAGAWKVFLVAGPVAAALGASALGLYPAVLRLMLFAVPLVLLLVMSGVDEAVASRSPVVRRLTWTVLGIIVVLPLFAVSFLESTSVNPSEHLRPLISELRRARHAGEPIYIFAGSIPAWTFYSTDWSITDRARFAAIERWAGSGGPAFENAPSRGHVVRDEGADLHYDTPAGRELYGISTGIEWRPIYGVQRRTTDSGWAENEARRIRAVAAPSVWVLLSHTVGNEIDLLRRLESLGGHAVYTRSLNDAILVRYEFAP